MKKILENLRNGERQIVLPELSVREIDGNQSLETTFKQEAITDFSYWDFSYPRYWDIGASVFNVIGGKVQSVPSLSFEATTVDINNDVLEGTKVLNIANTPPKRVGVQVSLRTELIASMTDSQLIAFIKAGAHAVNEEIFKNLIVEALDKGTHTANTLSASGLVSLESLINDSGSYFGGSKALTSLKSVVANGDYLMSGDMNGWGRSFSGMSALGTKKIPDTTIIGYGNFKFSAVVLYNGLTIIRDDITNAKFGDTVFTFSQLCNVGIIDNSKFATTQISTPVIVTQPTDVSRILGDTVILSVQSYGGATYVWKKGITQLVDDSRISGSTTNKLTIKGSVAGDIASDYTCEITNAIGTTITTATAISLV